MISAKLIKNLEKYGFSLEFPSYASIEDEIIEILKTRNKRLYLALPLLFQEKFDYNKISKRIDKKLIKEFNKILVIASKIFKLEGIPFYIKKNAKFSKADFQYYYNAFKDVRKEKEFFDEMHLKENINARSRLNINKALATIFSPGKRRIMEKIFNHEKLTNTELKYYYRSIRPLILAIANDEMRGYLRVVEAAKKYYD